MRSGVRLQGLTQLRRVWEPTPKLGALRDSLQAGWLARRRAGRGYLFSPTHLLCFLDLGPHSPPPPLGWTGRGCPGLFVPRIPLPQPGTAPTPPRWEGRLRAAAHRGPPRARRIAAPPRPIQPPRGRSVPTGTKSAGSAPPTRGLKPTPTPILLPPHTPNPLRAPRKLCALIAGCAKASWRGQLLSKECPGP